MDRQFIARRIAEEFKDGMVINLGFGMPTEAANFIPEGVNVILQTENGGLMFGPKPKRGESDPKSWEFRWTALYNASRSMCF